MEASLISAHHQADLSQPVVTLRDDQWLVNVQTGAVLSTSDYNLLTTNLQPHYFYCYNYHHASTTAIIHITIPDMPTTCGQTDKNQRKHIQINTNINIRRKHRLQQRSKADCITCSLVGVNNSGFILTPRSITALQFWQNLALDCIRNWMLIASSLSNSTQNNIRYSSELDHVWLKPIDVLRWNKRHAPTGEQDYF